jgi:hypothetical protein
VESWGAREREEADPRRAGASRPPTRGVPTECWGERKRSSQRERGGGGGGPNQAAHTHAH